MPFDPYGNRIVLEIATDTEDEGDDDDSEDSSFDYTAALAVKTKDIKQDKIKMKKKPQKRTRATKRAEEHKAPAKQRATRRPSRNMERATTSTRSKVPSSLLRDDDDTADRSYSPASDTVIDAIIESDGSLSIVTEEMVPDDIITEEVTVEVTTDPSPEELRLEEENVFTKLPNKYLLYDELIATIIGFDGETPVVEFASITRDELKNCELKLPVECGICPAILSSTMINDHLKIHQNPETKRFNCIYCDNTHCNRNSAAAHSRRHLGIRPYACDVCDNYFTTKNDLKLHYTRKHLEREFICEMCGKTYAQNTFLKRHILSHHHGLRPHQCEFCPKSYHRRGNLKEHIEAVHMGNRKPLSCRFCGIEFRDSHKLSRHRKEEHLNKSHFQCSPCGVEFTDIQFFNAHKRSIQCRNNRSALKMEVDPKEEYDDDTTPLS